MAIIGGRNAAYNVQFPGLRIPLLPGAVGLETMTSVHLVDVPAKFVSATADGHNYCPDSIF